MDDNTKFLMEWFRTELHAHEARMNAKFNAGQKEFSEIKSGIRKINATVNGINLFKAKVIGGSAVVSFLVTLGAMAVFNK